VQRGAVTLRLRLGIAASPLVDAADWPGLATAREGSSEPRVEGLMPKHCDSTYDIGRTGSAWWKVAPLSVDAALIYALAGHGRRANLYTDYSFAVWNRVMPQRPRPRSMRRARQAASRRWGRSLAVPRTWASRHCCPGAQGATRRPPSRWPSRTMGRNC